MKITTSHESSLDQVAIITKLVSEYQRKPAFTFAPSRTLICLQEESSSDTPNIQKIVELLTECPKLAQKLVLLANSAEFAGLSRVSSVQYALARVGVTNFQTLILTDRLRRCFINTPLAYRPIVRDLWTSALLHGRLCRALAQASEIENLVDGLAYNVGFLHEFGKLYSLECFSLLQKRNELSTITTADLKLGCSFLSAERGAEQAAVLRYPSLYQSTVRYYHAEETARDFVPASARPYLFIAQLVNRLLREPEEEVGSFVFSHLRSALQLQIPDATLLFVKLRKILTQRMLRKCDQTSWISINRRRPQRSREHGEVITQISS